MALRGKPGSAQIVAVKNWETKSMHRLVLIFMLIPFADAAARDKGGDLDACRHGRAEVARKASDYHGEERIKRLIDADLNRAQKEEAEGDADECLEALDHANNLMAGRY